VRPADPSLMHHVLSNLLGNAVRYSPAGTTVRVNLDMGETEFVLTVADEGIGIPEAERAGIFQPFIRGSNVGQISGTGLGLNIVQRYVELMGGSIELISSERGAKFRVRIPAATTET
jgi:signal transduction histidine kinase